MSEAKACGVCGTQEPFLSVLATTPDRAHGVDDEAGGEPEPRRDDGLPRGQAAYFMDNDLTSRKQIWACGAMNGSVHAASAQQPGIGRVDDCVRVRPRKIALAKFKTSLRKRPDGHQEASFQC
jgi:hypothetical protein